MTDEQRLKKVIKKAIKNGWKDGKKITTDDIYKRTEHATSNMGVKIIFTLTYKDIIFSHDFALALGYKLKDLGEWCDNGKEPLKYLESFL